MRRKNRSHRKSKRQQGKRGGSRRRRRNPGQPVILVNPTTATGKKLMRKNPRRSRRHGRRRSMRRRSNPSVFRRRNPSVSWGRSLMAMGLGGAAGVVGYGVNFGVEYIPVETVWRSVIFGGIGAVGSIALAKWAHTDLGAGMAGATAAILSGRIVTQMKASAAAPGTDAGAVYRMNAGRGSPRVGGARPRVEAGAVYQREAGAATTSRMPVFGPTFKEAGASKYIAGPVRWFGPASWAYKPDAGKVYVSAHNRR